MDKNFNVLDFAKDAGIELWDAQRFMLKILFKIPLTEDIVKIKEYPSGAIASYSEKDFINYLYFNSMINMDLAMYEKECKNSIPFKTPILILGRKSGKSFLSSLLLPYRAARLSYDGVDSSNINSSDTILGIIISNTYRESIVNIEQLCNNSKILRLRLSKKYLNKINIPYIINNEIRDIPSYEFRCLSNNFRLMCGGISNTVILDDAAYYSGKKIIQDIYRDACPRLCMFDDFLLMIITTLHKAEGFVYDKYTESMKRDSHELVFRLPTWYVNPNIDIQFLREEEERNPIYFRQQFGAEFIKEV